MRTPEAQRQFQKLVQARGNLARQALQQDPLKVTINLSGVTASGNLAPPQGGWTEAKVREIALVAVGQVVIQQNRLDNPVQKMFVDGSPFRPPDTFRSNITLLFNQGNNVRPVMRALEIEVTRRIPGTRWRWNVVSRTGRKALLEAAVTGRGPVLLEFGDRLYYSPASFSGTPDPTHANILYKRGNRPDGSGKRKRRGTKTGSTGGKGWYGLTATAVRGIGKKQGVHVTAVHTLKYTPAGRKLPPGVQVGQRINDLYYQGAWAFAIGLQFGSRGRR